jgi:hypothetical protein
LDPAAEELLCSTLPSSSHHLPPYFHLLIPNQPPESPFLTSPYVLFAFELWFRYECSIDVRELVSVEDVMTEMNLGPNGGLVYAMEYLVSNIDWLQVMATIIMFITSMIFLLF